MNKEYIVILNKNKLILENDVSNMTTRMNPDPIPGIYLTSFKVSQFIMVDDNRRENDEAKK